MYIVGIECWEINDLIRGWKMKVPDASEIARRFVEFAPGRASRYEAGVRAPTKDWEKETLDAESNYEDGIKKAIARKAFSKGVKKSGTAHQQAQTIKNIPRWVEGIEGALDVMTAAMEPVVTVMRAIVLPKRYPTGDDRNYAISKHVGQALRKAKEEGKF